METLPTPCKPTLCETSALELAALIACGRHSALEVVEAFIARVEQTHARLNALVLPRFAQAREEARAVDADRAAGRPLGPLAGVPITVKECLDLSGMASTFGIPSRRNHRAERDELHVARLRAAGAIVLGKSNVGQLLLMLETENPLYGRTVHPENAERSPGGSSGGEGALLAIGASALGVGTDLCGSVRVPAAFCGLYAIKPTTGRCDDLGRFSAPLGQRTLASQVGLLGRSVADLAVGLEVMNGGRKPAQRGSLTPAVELLDHASVNVAQLRVGYYEDDGSFSPAPAVRRAVREAVAKLEARGARVQKWAPPNIEQARALVFGLLSADSFAGCARALAGDARDPRIKKIEQAATMTRLVSWALAASGRKRLLREVVAQYGHDSADHYFQLVEATLDYRTRVLEACTDFDVIVCPATALPAFRHRAVEELVLAGAYTCLYNLLGWPAGVVPATRVRPDEESDRPLSRDPMDRAAAETERGSAGLPIGVQVAARPWREDLVLACMQALSP